MSVQLRMRPSDSRALALNVLGRLRLPHDPSAPFVVSHGLPLSEHERGVFVPVGSPATASDWDGDVLRSTGDGRFEARFDLFATTDAMLAGKCGGRSDSEEPELPSILSQRPVVDHWWNETALAALADARAHGREAVRVSPWPDGCTHAVMLSHDVDTFDGRTWLLLRKAYWLAMWARARVGGHDDAAARWMRRYDRWRGVPRDRDPDFLVPETAQLERRRGFCSTFYFFARRRTLTRELGRAYSVHSPVLRQVVRSLSELGFEVGVHGSHRDSTDGSAFAEERALMAEAMNASPTGIRQHNLNLRLAETWRAQSRAGFTYDASLGWNRAVGFRGGTALPVVVDGSTRFLVLPLVLQDGALVRRPNMLASELLATANRLRAATRDVGGMFSVLAHPALLDAREYPQWRAYYERQVDDLAEDGHAWTATGRAVAGAYDAMLAKLSHSLTPG